MARRRVPADGESEGFVPTLARNEAESWGSGDVYVPVVTL